MTTDTTAVVFLFESEEPDTFDVLPFFWMPAAKIRQLEVKLGVPLQQWDRDGFLELSTGDVIDYRDIRARLEWGSKMFDLEEICWDPWNSRQISVPMIEHGFSCEEIRQGYKTLNEPTKKILELVVRGALHHGGHPVLRWQAGCASTITDGRDNIMFSKPDREKSTSRVDGMAAIDNAMSRAIISSKKTITYKGLLSVG